MSVLVASRSEEIWVALQADVTGILLPVSAFIEWTATKKSSTIFIYDLAEYFDFGNLTKGWHQAGLTATPVVHLQTRSGAGSSIIGELLTQRTYEDRNSIITTYTSPHGLSSMVQTIFQTPAPTSTSRFIIQVPAVSSTGNATALTPSLAPLLAVINLVSANFAILLSSNPHETVQLTKLSYHVSDLHIIHVFDQYGSAREIQYNHASHLLNKPGEDFVGFKDALVQSGIHPFDYTGDPEAEVVIVLLNGTYTCLAKAFAADRKGFGIISVRVLRPWDGNAFRASCPETLKILYVFEDVTTDVSETVLYDDVLSSFFGEVGRRPNVLSKKITPDITQTLLEDPYTFLNLISAVVPSPIGSSNSFMANLTNMKRLLFFGSPASILRSLPWWISKAFSKQQSITARLQIDADSLSRPGGLEASRIIVSKTADNERFIPISLLIPLHTSKANEGGLSVDFLAILDQNLLRTHALIKYTGMRATLLIFTTWPAEELLANLAHEQIRILQDKGVQVYKIDPHSIADEIISADTRDDNNLLVIIAYIAFLRLYVGELAGESSLARFAYVVYGELLPNLDMQKLTALVSESLEKLDLISAVVKIDPSDKGQSSSTSLSNFEFNSTQCQLYDKSISYADVQLRLRDDGVKHMIFSELWTPLGSSPTDYVFPSVKSLRPDISESTYLVTCSINRRLTPVEYDRNVFHLEFDTKGTGLKYEIGEALGVYGWNDTQEVLKFCEWYGLDLDRLVTIPVSDLVGSYHTRTIFQTLQQEVDIFGRPPKSFYTDLAYYATDATERMTLQFIGSPEGSSTFKKLAEKDTITFADVLWRYRSARPSIEKLCEIVGYIKPRHYSIASAQSAVGDRVDLLVVTVDWITPSGSPRYGQCTRYLAGLKIGQKVTVSIKPSVMKLPPDDRQPLILAGLGTGAAPFRAFLQHRAFLSSQGKAIGPLYYYFGSRHRSQEYLYGEEIEAFIFDKIITKAGLAFSRDQKQKIYIQHKMLEDAEQLVQLLHDKKGVFYLCGPTWPVPDVHETLVTALVNYKAMEPRAAMDYLENLKEEERYVLEVY